MPGTGNRSSFKLTLFLRNTFEYRGIIAVNRNERLEMIDQKPQEERELEEAARRVASGDTEAFEVIVRRLEKKILSSCYGFVGNREEARELAQDVFLKVFRNLKNFRFDSSLSTWIYRICINCCIDHVNSKRRKFDRNVVRGDLPEGRVSGRVTSGIDGIIEKKEARKILREEIMNLPPKHRDAIILHDFNYLNCKEISQIVNCSEGTVMSRLFHARKKLFERLKGFFEP